MRFLTTPSLSLQGSPVALIVTKSVSVVGSTAHVPLTWLHCFSMGDRSGFLLVHYTTTIKSDIGIFGNVDRLPAPAGKLNHYLHKACLQYGVAYNFLVESFANFELDKNTADYQSVLKQLNFSASAFFLDLQKAPSFFSLPQVRRFWHDLVQVWLNPGMLI